MDQPVLARALFLLLSLITSVDQSNWAHFYTLIAMSLDAVILP